LAAATTTGIARPLLVATAGFVRTARLRYDRVNTTARIPNITAAANVAIVRIEIEFIAHPPLPTGHTETLGAWPLAHFSLLIDSKPRS
jgi:hypothetical protein